MYTLKTLQVLTVVELATWSVLVLLGFPAIGGILIAITTFTSLRQYQVIKRLEQGQN